MVGWDPRWVDGRDGQKETALTRYARWEYGPGSEEWFLSQVAGPQGLKRSRTSWLTSLLRGTRRRGVSQPNAGEPLPRAEARRVANDGGRALREGPTGNCMHGRRDHLGGGGSTSYFRCQECGHVLIAQGDRWWMLRGEGSP